MRGRFVVLEGGEGSGKSTQAEVLAARMGALLTREPGGTALGEAVRRLVKDPDGPPIGERAELLLLLAARAQHVEEVIRPALLSGRDVVCDRFTGSTVAYQGYGRGLPVAEVEAVSAFVSDGVEPDRVILLEVPASVALSRRALRGAADRFEEQGGEFFAAVDEGFRALAAHDPLVWVTVDGVGSVDEVAVRVWEAAQP